MKSLKNVSILRIAFVLSFCSFSYELVIAKTLSDYTGRPVIWQSITIGIYLLGLGIGAYLSERENSKPSIIRLLSTEALITIIGAISISLITLMNIFYRVTLTDNMNVVFKLAESGELTNQYDIYTAWIIPFTLFIVGAQFVTLLIGVLSGLEIPLLFALSKRNNMHHILGISALGTLAATLIFTFLLLPIFGVIHTAVIIASINGAVYWYISRYTAKKSYTVMGICIVVIATTYISAPTLQQFNVKTAYYYHTDEFSEPPKNGYFDYIINSPEIERHTSLYQYIDFVKERSNPNNVYSLYLDHHEQFYSQNQRDYHDSMAFVPLNLLGHVPQNILVLGAGDGLLVDRLLSLGDNIQHITQVELDGNMAQLADTHPKLTSLNHTPANNPKLQRIIGDAFYYIRNSKHTYDAIYIDFPYPDNYDKSRLFSQEFFTFVVSHLTDKGFAIIDAPITSEADINDTLTYYHTAMKNRNSSLISTAQQTQAHILPFEARNDSYIILTKNKEIIKRSSTLKNYTDFNKKLIAKPIFNQFPHTKNSHINSIFKPNKLSVDGFH